MPSYHVKAVIFEPDTLRIEWANEAATNAVERRFERSPVGMKVDEAVTWAQAMGVTEKAARAFETGTAERIDASVMSIEGPRIHLLAAVYRIPGDRMLLLCEVTSSD